MFEIRKPNTMLCKVLAPQSPEANTSYVPSQFALSFDYEGRHFVYSVLTGQCLEGELPARCEAADGHDALIEAHLLVPEGTDEADSCMALSEHLSQEARQAGLKSYSIFDTMHCNARCSYCSMWQDAELSPMTEETAEQVVRYILDTRYDGTIQLSWFGGEPLMNTPVIDLISSRLADAGVDFVSIMDTNGTLITPQVIDKMLNQWRIDRVQICMDGSEGDYVYRKHYYTSRDYYHLVLGAINLLAESGITVFVRCNVDEENCDDIPDFLDDLKAAVAHKENVKVYFSPLASARKADQGLDLWRKAIDARRLVREAGFTAALPVGLGLFSREERGAIAGDGISIGPDGSLYPHEFCPHNSQFGNVYTGQEGDGGRCTHCHVDGIQDKCLNCTFFPICEPYATCPQPDDDCQELRHMLVLSGLEDLIDKA